MILFNFIKLLEIYKCIILHAAIFLNAKIEHASGRTILYWSKLRTDEILQDLSLSIQ